MKELNIFNTYASKDFDVHFQKEAFLDSEVDIYHLRCGAEEIDAYVNDVVKPELIDFVDEQKSEIASYHLDLEGNILSLSGTNVEGSLVDLTDLALDDKYVSLNLQQNINAIKTFTQNPIVSNDVAPTVTLQNTSVLFGNAPQEDQISGINFAESTGTILGSVHNKVGADASVISSLSCSNLEATQSSEIAIGYDENGDVYTKAPTPAASDNSTKIATTAFVKGQGYTSNVGTVTSVNNTLPDANGNVTISVSGATWGSITGTLSNQTDLANALAAKYDASNPDGFISGITSSDVTTALGYTPVNPSGLATVATSGDYNDLTNKPTIPAAQVNSDWNASSGVAEILNKPTLGTMAAESASDYTKTSGLATVATTGDYDDLLDKPTIPTVNNATLTITQGGVSKGTFTANASSDVTIELDAGGGGSAAWGSITGTLSDQTDLQNALNAKANSASLATVATSGSYNDLSNKPTIPTTTNSVTSGSTAALTSGGAYTALQGYANTSLSNLSSDGQMVVDSQNGTISNCILEIPQTFTLEISGNTLTLKNGSKIPLTYYNNYTTTTTTQDWSVNFTTNGKYYIIAEPSGQLVSWWNYGSIGSGDTLPADNSQYSRFFLTTDKGIYLYQGGQWNVYPNRSYPLAIVEVKDGVLGFAKDSNGNDMIFNGAGFIGHHAFVYPNVKGLIPDGIDTDGTLKSDEFTTNSLLIVGLPTYTSSNRCVYYDYPNNRIYHQSYRADVNSVEDLAVVNWDLQYVKDDNKYYQYISNVLATHQYLPIIYFTNTDTTVTQFDIRQPYEGARNLLTDDIEEEIANMQTTTNLVTSVSSSSTDSQYPSAKLLYDTVGNIETLLNNINSGS